MKFQAIYRVTVYNQDSTIIIGAHEEKGQNGEVKLIQEQAKLTCHFNVSRGILSDSNKCTIQIFNLAPNTRELIFQDAFQISPEKWKFVKLEAGYGNDLTPIFMGRILQAYSYRQGGQVDMVTEIQAQALDMFDCQASYTFAAGTSYKEALQTMVSGSMPNVSIGNVGSLEGTFKTPTTFDGNAMENISKLTGGNAFVDNDQLNVLMSNEVIDVPVPVITENNGLLDTPNRRDANLEVKMLFEPSIIVGQLMEIQSSVQPSFNGQYKVMGFTHDCTISGAEAGSRTTTVNLYIGPFLPGAEEILSNESVTDNTGFNKVKGTNISPVSGDPYNSREVWLYIQKNNKAPHTLVTKSIYWDELIKSNSLAYGKPTLAQVVNLSYAANKLQSFVNANFQGARISVTSGWRSSGYNNTLSGSNPNSEHLYGNAIDFVLPQYNVQTVFNKIKQLWPGRKKGYKGFIHVDTTIARGVYANDW